MKLKSMSMAAMALSALLCLTTTGAMAQTTYKVSVKEGTEDASNWQGKAGEGEYQALPLEGVAAGTAVTVKYNGTKKVKSVKAVKKAAAAPALNLTSPAVGQVIGDDGKNYDYASLPGGVTAVAKICYVSGSNVLALALADEGQMNWSTAISTCAAHTPAFTGGTWKLATQDEWTNMITAAGSYTALRTGFSGITGADNLQSGYYWSSTENGSDRAWIYGFEYGDWGHDLKTKDDYIRVRACLAFYAPAATVTTAPTAKTGVKAGQNEAIVNAGTAEGGTMMYMVNATQPASTNGFSATVPTAEGLTAGTYYVWYYVEADDSHTDSEISATGIEVTIAAAGHALSASEVGEIVCSDGLAYAAADKDKLPQGVTAVAKICYVSGSNGLALALADEGQMNWSTAISTCAAHTPAITGGTWKLATQDEWNNMITAAGSYTALRDGFSSVGGFDLQSDRYWSSTEVDSSRAWRYRFDGGGWNDAYKDDGGIWVRACLAFSAATVTTAPTAKSGVKAGQNEAIVNAGTAEGGTMMYAVTTDNTQPASTDDFSDTVPTAEGLTAGTSYVWYYVKADASHTDSEISATAIAVTVAAPALNLTSPAVGQVIGSDGKNYAAGSLPSGVTAAAKICYVSGSNGLALALADEGQMNWSTAISTCAAHTSAFTGGTWKLATKDEWTNMITAAGSYTALRDGFSSVGGSNLQSGIYWTSTERENDSSKAWRFNFANGYWISDVKGDASFRVRACLAF